jgi:acyl carrier protein
VREYLRGQVPEYMVPGRLVWLEQMPLTANGKIDRRALSARTLQRAERYTAARTPLEVQLEAIWTEVLKIERVSVHENFFELGGQSLLATQLITRVRSELQVDIPLRHLFDAPTIAQLAIRIVEQRAEQLDEAELEQLLAELDELSDDDQDQPSKQIDENRMM